MVGRFARALLVTALLALAAVAVPRPAVAASDYLDVQLTSVSTPTLDLADPAQVVELTGTLTNVSTVPIRYVNVHFWRLSTPITSSRQLASVTAEVPIGARLTDEAAGNLDILTRDEEFAPGQRAEFSVKTTVAQLTAGQYALTSTDVAYLLGVQVRGIPSDGGNQVVGADQVVVAATTDPVESSALVLLSAPPSWTPDGDFTDAALLTDLGGRLETLLRSAVRHQRVRALAGCAQIVAAYPAASGGWEIHVIRHGRLAAAALAGAGEVPQAVARAAVAAAEAVAEPGGVLPAARRQRRQQHFRSSFAQRRVLPLRQVAGSTSCLR